MVFTWLAKTVHELRSRITKEGAMEKAMRVAFLIACITVSVAIVGLIANWGYVVTSAIGHLHERVKILEMQRVNDQPKDPKKG